VLHLLSKQSKLLPIFWTRAKQFSENYPYLDKYIWNVFVFFSTIRYRAKCRYIHHPLRQNCFGQERQKLSEAMMWGEYHLV